MKNSILNKIKDLKKYLGFVICNQGNYKWKPELRRTKQQLILLLAVIDIELND